jgi:tetratricopeptide (TPR) repeat protein
MHSLKTISDPKTSTENANQLESSHSPDVDSQIAQSVKAQNVEKVAEKKSIPKNTSEIKTEPEKQFSNAPKHYSPQISPVQQSFTFFNKGDYKSAIEKFKAIDLLSQPQVKQDSIIIYLMESYYKLRDVQQALSIGNAHQVNDGKYYFIIALCRVPLGMHAEALDAFERLTTTPFKIDPTSRKQALFQRARYYQRRFDNLATAEWENRAKSAWRDFLKSECVMDSPECEQAKNMSGEK